MYGCVGCCGSLDRGMVRWLGVLACGVVVTVAGAAGADEKTTAVEILDATGVRGGLVVHVGCGPSTTSTGSGQANSGQAGKLTAALRASESYLVHGLDGDAENVRQARAHIRSRGLCGKVSVRQFSGGRLPYAENFVNLLVSEDLGGVPMAEVMRVLAPRGVAYVKGGGVWRKTVKPWPAEMDEWTHWLHGPEGNAVSRDRLVGPPRRLQWTARPLWMRHHDMATSASSMVSAGGRVFTILDEAPAGVGGRIPDKWFLVARDAFNGVELWKRPMPQWGWSQWTVNWHGRNNQPVQLAKRLVAVGNTVYTTLAFNGPVSALDAATGEVRRTYQATGNTDEILVAGGLLVLSLNDTPHKPADSGEARPIGKSVAVVEIETGKMLWKKGGFTGLRAKTDSSAPLGRLELTVGGGRVYLTDQNAIVALDLRDGRELWRTPRPKAALYKANFNTIMSELCVLVYSDGVLLFAQPEGGISFHTVPGTLLALSAAEGKALWKRQYGGWVHNTAPNIFAIDGLVWIHEHQQPTWSSKGPPADAQSKLAYAALGVDLKTGEEKRRFSTRETFDVGHHHRCYRTKATERFLLMSRRGVEFLDLESGENHLHHWVRGMCHLGIMPANGLLYSSPHPCSCHIATKLNGYFALAPAAAKASAGGPALATDPLEKGPDYGATPQSALRQAQGKQSNDWPTFRGDALRSGSTETPVSPKLTLRWTADVGESVGPLTATGGKLFAPVVDEHRVVTLDAADGREIWSFTAGGRVDTPPTIHGGLALFGSADGSVYCVRAADGQLLWRRRLAPSDRLVGTEGQLESPWPVHGSVLVKDGLAYAAAGRSTYLDGGIHFYALKPATGEVVERRVEYSPDPKTDEMPPGDAFKLPGMLADILVSNGESVWMRQHRIFGDEDSAGRGALVATGGLRDDT